MVLIIMEKKLLVEIFRKYVVYVSVICSIDRQKRESRKQCMCVDRLNYSKIIVDDETVSFFYYYFELLKC